MRRLTAQFGLLALTLALCALALPGCANCRLPQIDPSGQNLFVDPAAAPQAAFRDTPSTSKESKRVELIVCPRATVAPIGSEVILLAGVRGPDQYLRTNERVEWMIDPGGVGQLVDLDKGSWTDAFVGDFTNAKKIDNGYAVNTTSRRLLRLTRGTPEKTDDVEVLKGQAWVTLTSASEGTSDVTVYCPGISPWESRTESCQVHWVDAGWTFPSVAIAQSGGRQLLTTSVNRQSDGAPRSGWIVRYEILDGPPAAFAPDGSQIVEVPTGPQGKAAVELFQPQSQAGTNKISIQVIRPEGLGCPNQRLVVGRTCLAQTWSAPDLGVRVSGPTVGSVGSSLGFRIEVSNPGNMAAEGIALTTPVPPGLRYVSASPPSEGTGSSLRWNIGRLAAGEVRSIALDVRAEQSGQYEVCSEAVATSGLSARGCANVAIEAADLAVKVLGATEATVGESVTHRIVVTNRSRVPATALILTDVRDPGLEHNIAKLQIEKSLGDLGPMQSQEVTITFRALEAGQQCHTVQITGAGGLRASRPACVEVREAVGQQPSPPSAQLSPSTPWNQPEPSVPPPATPIAPNLPRFEMNAKFAVDAKSQEPIREGKEGGTVVLMLDVSSPDNLDLADLTLSIQLAPVFFPLEATGGYTKNGDTFTWQSFGVQQGTLGRVAIVCRCEAKSASGCFYATVTDANGTNQNREACIPIYAAQEPDPMASTNPNVESTPGLDVKINTTQKPVHQGATFTYSVLVSNRSAIEDRDVLMQVAFPPGLTPQQWLTRGPTRFVISNNKVVFDAVRSLPAGKWLEYTILVKADEVGEQYQVQADSKSANQPEPVSGYDLIRVAPPF